MGFMKCSILAVMLLMVGCMALPTLEDELDLSIYFEHVDRNARIVGGATAQAGSHPHMVALSSGLILRSYLCGGSIIGSRTVLTAAHCIAHVFSGGSLTNTLRGTAGTDRWNSGGTHYSFARNVTHPNYVPSLIKNDIGMLITTTNIVNTVLIRTIALNYDWIGQGVAVRVAGWGRIRQNGALSTNLLEIITSTIEGQRCVREVFQASIDFNIRPPAPPVEPHIEICTFHSAGHGTCNGDSGSAMARIDNGQQVGIVSWGIPCARGAPDMFVRISAYRNWITANII